MKNYVLKKISAVILAMILAFSAFSAGVFMTSAAPVFGDLDNNGQVNSTDALFILQITVGQKEKTEEIVFCGDVDVNGDVNSSDALLVLKKSVGQEIKLSDFSISTDNATVSVGYEIQLSTVDIRPRLAENTTVEWSVSDDKIATVDAEGRVKGISAGTVTVKAKSTDGSEIEKTATVNVVNLIESVKAEKTSVILEQGSLYEQNLTFAPSENINSKMNWVSSNTDIATVDENGVIKAERIGTATVTGTTTDGTNKSVSCKVTVVAMTIPYVNQMPKYPTGCEAASCCMLLRYYGFDIDMDQMVEIIPRKNLYKKNGKTYGPDINEMFVGDPRYTYTSSTPGYGVFSPAVTKALQTAIDELGGGYTAVKISGCSFTQLLRYIKDGSPVIVWATYKMQNSTTVNAWYIEGTGEYFEYPRGTHVMILSGYSPTTVTTVDPYNNGVLTFAMSKFKAKWELLGQQAVVLVKNK